MNILDNLKSWKNIPKRSNSLICTTSRQYTTEFGKNRYIVIPYDNAKIIHCMEKDFWHVEIIELENIDILIHKFEDILTFDSSTSHKIDLTVLNNTINEIITKFIDNDFYNKDWKNLSSTKSDYNMIFKSYKNI